MSVASGADCAHCGTDDDTCSRVCAAGGIPCCSACASTGGCTHDAPAPHPAVQAESTGGLNQAECDVLRPLVWQRRWIAVQETVERILAARDAVQAREVAEARADERERIARAIEENCERSPLAVALGMRRAARLARAGGEGE